MIPLKWKLYKALNYIQLTYSFLFFMWLTWLLISIPQLPERSDAAIMRSFVLLLFLFLSVHPVINIILLAKNFPDKVLSGSKKTLFIISLVMNILTAPCLFILTIAGFISEMEEQPASRENNLVKIFLTILALMSFVNLFLLICQFGLRSYLKKNSLHSIRSLIESIGNTNPENSHD